MTCGECGREHRVEGRVLVDGLPVPRAWVEVMVETICGAGKLPGTGTEVLVEPDA